MGATLDVPMVGMYLKGLGETRVIKARRRVGNLFGGESRDYSPRKALRTMSDSSSSRPVPWATTRPVWIT